MNPEQFTAAVERLIPKLAALTGRMLGSSRSTEAEDVVQETMMKLWMMRDSLDESKHPERLAITIARRIAIDHARHGAFTCEIEIPAMDTPLEPEAEALLKQADMEIAASEVLASLPQRQAMVMRMRHIDGLENSEIAQITGLSEQNVRVLLCRARTTARDYIMKNKNRIHY